MKTLKLFALSILLAAASFAQLTTQSTTLSAAAVQATGSSTSNLYDTYYVASTTGMVAQSSLGAYNTWLYVDSEASPVVSVISTTAVQVLRGSGTDNLGTVSQAHISGATVLFGPYNNFVQGTSLISPAGTGVLDPQGSCVAAQFQYLPLINTANGHLIACDAVSSTSSIWARTGQWGFVSPAGCGELATTTAVTDDGMVPLATGVVVRKLVTNTTAGTTQITCTITPTSLALSNGKGIIVTGVSLVYGVQGSGGITSIAAATIQSLTWPAPGGTAKGTVGSAAGGTLTVTPASVQIAATTSAQFYNEFLSFGTPFYANTNYQTLTFDQVITNSTTALTYQIWGLQVYYDQPT